MIKQGNIKTKSNSKWSMSTNLPCRGTDRVRKLYHGKINMTRRAYRARPLPWRHPRPISPIPRQPTPWLTGSIGSCADKLVVPLLTHRARSKMIPWYQLPCNCTHGTTLVGGIRRQATINGQDRQSKWTHWIRMRRYYWSDMQSQTEPNKARMHNTRNATKTLS